MDLLVCARASALVCPPIQIHLHVYCVICDVLYLEIVRVDVIDGLRITYFWIKEQLEKEKAGGVDVTSYGSSKVVSTQAPVQLGSLRAADGNE
ncbi:GDP-D-mannose-3,5-epimerase [Trifolium pratense]|uniref:GDP-D-mannose-3,5-epimerase n=1 Tax=Trifolium pratense TaxID=57577 RepID=A0A2K3M799_TRIPR|nr:GDP-D-mannose-3,5-epimerase [Trifolium pratense]